MAATQVDIQGMVAAQSTFQTALDDTTNSYAQMDGQFISLQSSWQGDAATIYHQAMQEWLNDFSKVNAALQRMLESLSSNTNVYATVHSDTESAANRVSSTMTYGGGLQNFPI